jgi:hypothetical protein
LPPPEMLSRSLSVSSAAAMGGALRSCLLLGSIIPLSFVCELFAMGSLFSLLSPLGTRVRDCSTLSAKPESLEGPSLGSTCCSERVRRRPDGSPRDVLLTYTRALHHSDGIDIHGDVVHQRVIFCFATSTTMRLPDQRWCLSRLYENSPKPSVSVRYPSERHCGACELRLGGRDGEEPAGEYLTDRLTRGVDGWRELLAELVRPVPVVMTDVVSQRGGQVPFDEGVVQALPPYGADPAFCECVGRRSQLHRMRMIGSDVFG